jgi:hypothetical protein
VRSPLQTSPSRARLFASATNKRNPSVYRSRRCPKKAQDAMLSAHAARLRLGETTVRGDGFTHLLRPRETRPAPKGRERRRAVKADLSAFESPAERLR